MNLLELTSDFLDFKAFKKEWISGSTKQPKQQLSFSSHYHPSNTVTMLTSFCNIISSFMVNDEFSDFMDENKRSVW